MTMDDLRDGFSQADALGWKPSITIVGGEPTLHPDFTALVKACVEWSGGRVQVWSNAYRPQADELLQIARRDGASVCKETEKRAGAIRFPKPPGEFWVRDTFVSPADFGITRKPCFQHGAAICGVSLDAHGFSPCAMGNTIAGLLGVACRTKVLADLFDKEKVAEMTRVMCLSCGQQFSDRQPEIDIEALPKMFGVPVSPTWAAALEGRR
jgi:hypothetical protein